MFRKIIKLKMQNLLVTKNAAILIKEEDLDKQFKNEFNQLINSKSLQSKLSKNIKSLAKPNATKDIVDEIRKIIKRDSFLE